MTGANGITTETKRRRGWIDYRLVVFGGYRNAFLTTFSGGQEIKTKPEIPHHEESAEAFLKMFEVCGGVKLVQVVTPPSAFGRMPNHRAFDKTNQSADAVVLLVSEGIAWNRLPIAVLFSFLTVSLQGQNDMYLNTDVLPEPPSHKDPPPPAPMTRLREHHSLLRRPVGILINKEASSEENLQLRVRQCEEFMTNIGRNIGVRSFGVVNFEDSQRVEEIVQTLCEDVEANRGVLFKPPEKLPWQPTNVTMDDYLELQYERVTGEKYHDADNNNNNNNHKSKVATNNPSSDSWLSEVRRWLSW
eukprot:TRINITY_DN610_c0_g1_i1.p1 TRINITY_DN610_c0_g1~~TRINITY_DN610_c0_g1_i1.p1  ORF type:complete len:302 (-),score=73.54 TRINITY_DN610_c0_g1_i1:331-1236(-)